MPAHDCQQLNYILWGLAMAIVLTKKCRLLQTAYHITIKVASDTWKPLSCILSQEEQSLPVVRAAV